MKSKLTMAFAIMLSLSAHAQYSSDPYGSARFANASAINVCQKLIFSDSKMTCLQAVQGRNYSDTAVATCATLTFDDAKVECLQKIANKYVQDEMATSCKNDYVFDSDKIQCLQDFSDKMYQAEAVTVCKKMTFSDSRLSCLKIIENKMYDVNMLSVCKSNVFDDDKANCLRALYSSPISYYENERRPIYNSNQGRSDVSISINVGGVHGSIGVQNSGGNDSYRNNQTCTINKTGQIVQVDKFYQVVSSSARSYGKCAIARMGHTAGSGRIYNEVGQRVASDMGGLTYDQVDNVKRSYGLKGCMDYICDKN